MLDESQSKIAELETKTRQLQARHDAFEAKLATSVDQQTVAVRTHFRQELDAAEEVHRSQVESLHQKAVQHVEANASDMAAALQQAFLQMETEKSELVRSYNDQLAAAEAKVSATTKECGSALEQIVTFPTRGWLTHDNELRRIAKEDNTIFAFGHLSSYPAMPAADDKERTRELKELEKIEGAITKIHKQTSHQEMLNMFILGASADLLRQSGVKL